MKKHLVKFTLMLLAIALGVSNAFAEDVYKKDGEDKTGTYRWTTNDVAEWSGTELDKKGKDLIFPKLVLQAENLLLIVKNLW